MTTDNLIRTAHTLAHDPRATFLDLGVTDEALRDHARRLTERQADHLARGSIDQASSCACDVADLVTAMRVVRRRMAAVRRAA